MEIERKYLVDEKDIVEVIQNAKVKKIIQAYLQVGEEEKRVRKKDDKFYLTIKKGSGLKREEIETKIDEKEFNNLLKKKIGNIISKTRYEVKLEQDLIAELDVYHNDLEGLYTVEVEFQSENQANSFNAPIWFGREITNDKSFKNQSLALKGNPLKNLENKTLFVIN
jgi:CYTH domain-containing protein